MNHYVQLVATWLVYGIGLAGLVGLVAFAWYWAINGIGRAFRLESAFAEFLRWHWSGRRSRARQGDEG